MVNLDRLVEQTLNYYWNTLEPYFVKSRVSLHKLGAVPGNEFVEHAENGTDHSISAEKKVGKTAPQVPLAAGPAPSRMKPGPGMNAGGTRAELADSTGMNAGRVDGQKKNLQGLISGFKELEQLGTSPIVAKQALVDA